MSKRMSDDELRREAQRWDSRRASPRDLPNAPDAVPRVSESTLISIRLPNTMLALLREFARREGLGYQVLMKRWLDERIRQERERPRAKRDDSARLSLGTKRRE